MRVLVADDDRAFATEVSSFLGQCGHDVVATVTSGGLDVLRAYDESQPDLVLMDVMMPRFNGFTICHAILSKRPHARVILMCGRLRSDHPFVVNSGATLFLQKPFRFSRLRTVMEEMAASLVAVAS
jgi:DNA-binding response OmpR family regulator